MATKILLISPESDRCTCGGGIPQCVSMITEDRWRRMLKYAETHQLYHYEETRKANHECRLQIDLNRLMRKCRLIEHTGHASCLLFDAVKNKQFVNAVETAIARDLVGASAPPATTVKPNEVVLTKAPVLPSYLPGKFPNKLIWFMDMFIADPTFAARYQTPEWVKAAGEDATVAAAKKPELKLRKTARFMWAKVQADPDRIGRYLAEYNLAKKIAKTTKPAVAHEDMEVDTLVDNAKPPSESDSDDD